MNDFNPRQNRNVSRPMEQQRRSFLLSALRMQQQRLQIMNNYSGNMQNAPTNVNEGFPGMQQTAATGPVQGNRFLISTPDINSQGTSRQTAPNPPARYLTSLSNQGTGNSNNVASYGNEEFYTGTGDQRTSPSDSMQDSTGSVNAMLQARQPVMRNVSQQGMTFRHFTPQGVSHRSMSLNDAHPQNQTSSLNFSSSRNASMRNEQMTMTNPLMPSATVHPRQSSKTFPILPTLDPYLNTHDQTPSMGSQATAYRPVLNQNQTRFNASRLPTQHCTTQENSSQSGQDIQGTASNTNASVRQRQSHCRVEVHLQNDLSLNAPVIGKTINVCTVDGSVFPVTISPSTFRLLLQEISRSLAQARINDGSTTTPTNARVNIQRDIANVSARAPVHTESSTAYDTPSTRDTTAYMQGSPVNVPAMAFSLNNPVNSPTSSRTSLTTMQPGGQGDSTVEPRFNIATTSAQNFPFASQSLVTTAVSSAAFSNSQTSMPIDTNNLVQQTVASATSASSPASNSMCENTDLSGNFKIPEAMQSNSSSPLSTTSCSEPAIAKEIWDYIYSPQVTNHMIDDEPQAESLLFWTCDPEKWKKENENQLRILSERNQNLQSSTTSASSANNESISVRLIPNSDCMVKDSTPSMSATTSTSIGLLPNPEGIQGSATSTSATSTNIGSLPNPEGIQGSATSTSAASNTSIGSLPNPEGIQSSATSTSAASNTSTNTRSIPNSEGIPGSATLTSAASSTSIDSLLNPEGIQGSATSTSAASNTSIGSLPNPEGIHGSTTSTNAASNTSIGSLPNPEGIQSSTTSTSAASNTSTNTRSIPNSEGIPGSATLTSAANSTSISSLPNPEGIKGSATSTSAASNTSIGSLPNPEGIQGSTTSTSAASNTSTCDRSIPNSGCTVQGSATSMGAASNSIRSLPNPAGIQGPTTSTSATSNSVRSIRNSECRVQGSTTSTGAAVTSIKLLPNPEGIQGSTTSTSAESITIINVRSIANSGCRVQGSNTSTSAENNAIISLGSMQRKGSECGQHEHTGPRTESSDVDKNISGLNSNVISSQSSITKGLTQNTLSNLSPDRIKTNCSNQTPAVKEQVAESLNRIGSHNEKSNEKLAEGEKSVNQGHRKVADLCSSSHSVPNKEKSNVGTEKRSSSMLGSQQPSDIQGNLHKNPTTHMYISTKTDTNPLVLKLTKSKRRFKCTGQDAKRSFSPQMGRPGNVNDSSARKSTIDFERFKNSSNSPSLRTAETSQLSPDHNTTLADNKNQSTVSSKTSVVRDLSLFKVQQVQSNHSCSSGGSKHELVQGDNATATSLPHTISKSSDVYAVKSSSTLTTTTSLLSIEANSSAAMLSSKPVTTSDITEKNSSPYEKLVSPRLADWLISQRAEPISFQQISDSDDLSNELLEKFSSVVPENLALINPTVIPHKLPEEFLSTDVSDTFRHNRDKLKESTVSNHQTEENLSTQPKQMDVETENQIEPNEAESVRAQSQIAAISQDKKVLPMVKILGNSMNPGKSTPLFQKYQNKNDNCDIKKFPLISLGKDGKTTTEFPIFQKSKEYSSHQDEGRCLDDATGSQKATLKDNQITNKSPCQKTTQQNREVGSCSSSARKGDTVDKFSQSASSSVLNSSRDSVLSGSSMSETNTKKLKIKPNLSKLHAGGKKLSKPLLLLLKGPATKLSHFNRFNQLPYSKSTIHNDVTNVSLNQSNQTLSKLTNQSEATKDKETAKSQPIESKKSDTKQINNPETSQPDNKTKPAHCVHTGGAYSDISSSDEEDTNAIEVKVTSKTSGKVAERLSDICNEHRNETNSNLGKKKLSSEKMDDFASDDCQEKIIASKKFTAKVSDQYSDMSHDDDSITHTKSANASKTCWRNSTKHINKFSNLSTNDRNIVQSTSAQKHSGFVQPVNKFSDTAIQNKNKVPTDDKLSDISDKEEIGHSNQAHVTQTTNSLKNPLSRLSHAMRGDRKDVRQGKAKCSKFDVSDTDADLVIDTEKGYSGKENKNVSFDRMNSVTSDESWPFSIPCMDASSQDPLQSSFLSDSSSVKIHRSTFGPTQVFERINSVESIESGCLNEGESLSVSNERKEGVELSPTSSERLHSVEPSKSRDLNEKEISSERSFTSATTDQILNHSTTSQPDFAANVDPSRQENVPIERLSIFETLQNMGGFLTSPVKDCTTETNSQLPSGVQVSPIHSIQLNSLNEQSTSFANEMNSNGALPSFGHSSGFVHLKNLTGTTSKRTESLKSSNQVIENKSSTGEEDNEPVVHDIKPDINELSEVVKKSIKKEKGLAENSGDNIKSAGSVERPTDEISNTTDTEILDMDSSTANAPNNEELASITDSNPTAAESITAAEDIPATALTSTKESTDTSTPGSRLKSLFNLLLTGVEPPTNQANARNLNSAEKDQNETNEESNEQDSEDESENGEPESSNSAVNPIFNAKDESHLCNDLDSINPISSRTSEKRKKDMLSTTEADLKIIKKEPTSLCDRIYSTLCKPDDDLLASTDSDSENPPNHRPSTDRVKSKKSEQLSSNAQPKAQMANSLKMTTANDDELLASSDPDSESISSLNCPNSVRQGSSRTNKIFLSTAPVRTESTEALENTAQSIGKSQLSVADGKVLLSSKTQSSTSNVKMTSGAERDSPKANSFANTEKPGPINSEVADKMPGSVDSKAMDDMSRSADSDASDDMQEVDSVVTDKRPEPDGPAVADEMVGSLNSDSASETSGIPSDVDTLVIDENCDGTNDLNDINSDVINPTTLAGKRNDLIKSFSPILSGDNSEVVSRIISGFSEVTAAIDSTSRSLCRKAMPAGGRARDKVNRVRKAPGRQATGTSSQARESCKGISMPKSPVAQGANVRKAPGRQPIGTESRARESGKGPSMRKTQGTNVRKSLGRQATGTDGRARESGKGTSMQKPSGKQGTKSRKPHSKQGTNSVKPHGSQATGTDGQARKSGKGTSIQKPPGKQGTNSGKPHGRQATGTDNQAKESGKGTNVRRSPGKQATATGSQSRDSGKDSSVQKPPGMKTGNVFAEEDERINNPVKAQTPHGMESAISNSPAKDPNEEDNSISSPLKIQTPRKSCLIYSSSDNDFSAPYTSTRLNDTSDLSDSPIVPLRLKKSKPIVISSDEDVDVVNREIDKQASTSKRKKTKSKNKNTSSKNLPSSPDCTKQREYVTDNSDSLDGDKELPTKHNHPFILMDYSSEEDKDKYDDIVISVRHRKPKLARKKKKIILDATDVDYVEVDSDQSSELSVLDLTNADVYESDSHHSLSSVDTNFDALTGGNTDLEIPEMSLRGGDEEAFDESSPNKFTYTVVEKIGTHSDTEVNMEVEGHSSDVNKDDQPSTSQSSFVKRKRQKSLTKKKLGGKISSTATLISRKGGRISPGLFTEPIKSPLNMISDYISKKYEAAEFDSDEIVSESEAENEREPLTKRPRLSKDVQRAHERVPLSKKESKVRRRLTDTSSRNPSRFAPIVLRGSIRTALGTSAAWFTRDKCVLKPCSVVLEKHEETRTDQDDDSDRGDYYL